MRLVKTGPNGPWVERYDVDTCTDCGRKFNPDQAVKGHLPCQCAGDGETGHRILHCPACGHGNYDPPHVIQTGPTADYGQDGGVSTHRPMRDGTAPT